MSGKKVIAGLLAAALLAVSLGACGWGEAPAGSTEGKVINIYCWNDEFQQRLEAVYDQVENSSRDGTVTYLRDGTEIHWTTFPNENGIYQNGLDAALAARNSAKPEDRIDLFLTEADYVTKYTDAEADAAIPLTELGIDPDRDLADQYSFTRAVTCDQNGVQRGSTWQCCPGLLVYRRDIAELVFGTDDPAVISEKTGSWKALNATARALRDKGYYTFASYADTFRLFGSSMSQSWVQPGSSTVHVDAQIMRWIDHSKKWLDAGYFDSAVKGQFVDNWYEAVIPSSKVFAFLLPAWGINYVVDAHWDGPNGVWAVAAPPQEYNWGGSFLHACTGTDNPEHVRDIILAMTADKDNLMTISRYFSDFTNTREGMREAAKDDSFASDFLGGQNPFPYFVPVAEKLQMAPLSPYDLGCVELIERCFGPYFEGTVSLETAKRNFEAAIVERYPDITGVSWDSE